MKGIAWQAYYNTRQKSWDTLHIFNLDGTFAPLPPKQCWIWKIFRAQKCQVSQKEINIALGGRGKVRQGVVAELLRKLKFLVMFCKCPRDFWQVFNSIS